MHSVRPAFRRSSSRDALVDTRAPGIREPRPVAALGGAIRRELGQLRADLLERQADSLGEHDERDPPQNRPREAAVARARALGADQAALLVEAQSADAATPLRLATSPIVSRSASGAGRHLTSSLLELVLWWTGMTQQRQQDRQSAGRRIIDEVTSWPGVEAVQGDRGELSLRVGRREIGHLHGDRALHSATRRRSGRALRDGPDRLPPGLPGQARLGSRAIAERGRRLDVIELLRINYDRAAAKGV